MSLKEVLVDIIIPLIVGFIGGSIGSVVIIKTKYTSIDTIKKDKRITFLSTGLQPLSSTQGRGTGPVFLFHI